MRAVTVHFEWSSTELYAAALPGMEITGYASDLSAAAASRRADQRRGGAGSTVDDFGTLSSYGHSYCTGVVTGDRSRGRFNREEFLDFRVYNTHTNILRYNEQPRNGLTWFFFFFFYFGNVQTMTEFVRHRRFFTELRVIFGSSTIFA